MIAEADHLLIILHQPPSEDRMDREPALFLRNPNGSWMANGYDAGELKLRKLLGAYREKWEGATRRMMRRRIRRHC